VLLTGLRRGERMAVARLTSSGEDYIEAIYLLGGATGPVRSVDLATHMDVSKASVNKAVASLKERQLVEQPYYGDITLTEQGISYAQRVLKRHRTLKSFLTDVLGVDDDVAEEEACIMEHAISDDTLLRLEEHLRASTS
jgi:Mn-dependent DtxR family transcriptional regulator